MRDFLFSSNLDDYYLLSLLPYNNRPACGGVYQRRSLDQKKLKVKIILFCFQCSGIYKSSMMIFGGL